MKAHSLFSAAGLLLLCGCFSLQGSKGRLSDRVDAASDTTKRTPATYSDRSSNHHNHECDDDRESPWGELLADLISGVIRAEIDRPAKRAPDSLQVVAVDSAKPTPLMAQDNSNDKTIWLSFGGGNGSVVGPKTNGYAHWAFRGALEQPNGLQYSLELNAGHSDADPSARLSRAIDGISVAFADARVSYLLTKPHTFLGAYIFGGLGYGMQWWQYHDGGHDAVDGIDLYGGAGVNLVRTSHFRLSLEARPGFIIWMPKTMQGYDNNVFGSMGYIKIGPELSVHF